MKEKISIIIPCYNVENELRRCLDSVFAQDVQSADYEVICVDDKSTDTTLDILLEYEKKHPENMAVIPLDSNGKQGHARNVAFEYAGGEYITYVDADDVIAPGMLRILYDNLKKYDCDVAECNYKMFTEVCDYNVETAGKIENYDMQDVSWKKACILRRFSRTSPWGRLYKRTLIKNNDIFFPEDITMEDVYFSEMSMAYMTKYVWLPQTLYFYYVNTNGTYFNPQAAKYYMDALRVQNFAIDRIRSERLDFNCEKEYEYHYFWNAFCGIIRRMILDKNFFSYENYLLAYQEVGERYPNILQNIYVLTSEAELIKFSIELFKRIFSKKELAMAMYGDSYADVLDD